MAASKIMELLAKKGGGSKSSTQQKKPSKTKYQQTRPKQLSKQMSANQKVIDILKDLDFSSTADFVRKIQNIFVLQFWCF